MSALALLFNDTPFTVIDRNSQPWLKQSEIACALYGVTKGGGQSDAPFENAEKSLKRLYARNADEFTDSMTALVELDTNGGKQQVRIFSLRGCHLLAMFARTTVAKEFRKWVLDVLEKHTQPSTRYGLIDLPEPPTITKAQAGELFNRVTVIASGSGKIRAELWSRFQNHFKLSSYKDLPADQYDEAIAYLDAKRDEYLGAGVEMLYLSNQELEARIAERVKALEGELIGKSEQAIGPADTVIRIGMDGGIKYMMLSLHGTADAPARFLVDVSRSSVYINSVQHEALALTEREFIDFLVKERGYIVVKKAEVVSKLAS